MADVQALQAEVRELRLALTEQQQAGSAVAAAADTFWLFLGTVLVFYMQCGFALLEAGAVRSKTTQNILLKNLVDACLGGILWYFIGYPLATGASETNPNPFIGTQWNALAGNADWASWMFSWAFAATAATIVSGAVAERCEFNAYLIYTVGLTALVYPPVAYWGWNSNGWLADMGFHDFGGACIVHMLGGVAALVAAVAIGPRMGRFTIDHNGKRQTVDIPGHSAVLCVMGCLILWFGWYGFNPVSTGSFLAMQTAVRVAVTTTLSACGGGLSCLITSMLYKNPPTVSACLNGVLAGLVGITGACGVVEPYAAIIIGFIAGPLYYHVAKGLQRLGVDDPLDASPVHCFCGMWGTIAVGLFATKEFAAEAFGVAIEDVADHAGLFYGGNGKQLGVQLAGLLAILAWSVVLCSIMFGTLAALKMLRVPAEHELLGLDITHHGGSAYNFEGGADVSQRANEQDDAPLIKSAQSAAQPADTQIAAVTNDPVQAWSA